MHNTIEQWNSSVLNFTDTQTWRDGIWVQVVYLLLFIGEAFEECLLSKIVQRELWNNQMSRLHFFFRSWSCVPNRIHPPCSLIEPWDHWRRTWIQGLLLLVGSIQTFQALRIPRPRDGVPLVASIVQRWRRRHQWPSNPAHAQEGLLRREERQRCLDSKERKVILCLTFIVWITSSSVSPRPSMRLVLVYRSGLTFLACSRVDKLCLYPARGSRTN